MSPTYTIPPAFIGLIVAVAVVVAAYYYGFAAGYAAGRDEGYGDGKREGAREGSMRGYAVGFDRGRRRDGGEDDGGDDEPSRRRGIGIAALILGAIALVVLINRPREPFDPSLSPSIDEVDSPPSRLLGEPAIDDESWPQNSVNESYRAPPEYVPGDLLDEPSID